MLLASVILACVVMGAPPNGDPKDVTAQIAEASRLALKSSEKATALLRDGKADEATATIVETFPEKTRTPAQAFVLGNVLFRQEPGLSYPLHKLAAAEIGEIADVQLEWALEQHRAKEYAGAVAAYRKYLDKHPDRAPVHGLIAECLLRTGKAAEACNAWKASERAQSGTLEQLEAMVCEVHSGAMPDRERANLLAKAAKGDVDAAERVILLDADWRMDWWNEGPREDYLEHDLAAIRAAGIAPSARLTAALCAGDCWLASVTEKGNIGDILKAAGLLVDEKHTLPGSGRVLPSLLGAAIESGAMTRERARAVLGPAIVALAKSSKEAEVYNAAGYLYVGTPQLQDIDLAGWDATGDVRFAASYLLGQSAAGPVGLDSARLQKGIGQFAESAEIAGIALEAARKAGKPLEPYLVAAIKAEYTHMSMGGPLSPRPGAKALRRYFGMLAKEQAPAANAPGPASK